MPVTTADIIMVVVINMDITAAGAIMGIDTTARIMTAINAAVEARSVPELLRLALGKALLVTVSRGRARKVRARRPFRQMIGTTLYLPVTMTCPWALNL